MVFLGDTMSNYIPDIRYEGEEAEKEFMLEGATSDQDSRKATSFCRRKWSIACLVASFLIFLSIGFVLGRCDSISRISSSHRSTSAHKSLPQDALPSKLSPVSIVFESNRSFLEPPSEANDALWRSLYPKCHGVFQWPDDKPQRAGFAAFHQLHCLDALRKSWYADQDIKRALIEGETPVKKEPFPDVHVLHCVEFLRQSLMCQADTSVQYAPEGHTGILAFGGRHQCRDWKQLVEWVDERNDKTSFGTPDC